MANPVPTVSLPTLFKEVDRLSTSLRGRVVIPLASVRDLDAVRHVIQGFEALSQGRGGPEATSRFRAEMKTASDEQEGDAQVLLQHASHPGTPVQAPLIRQLNEWTRNKLAMLKHQLETLRDAQQPSPAHSAREAMMALLGDDEVAGPPEKKRRRVIEEDDNFTSSEKKTEKSENVEMEEADQEEEWVDEDNELQEEGVAVTLSPLIWQDMNTSEWKWAAFTDGQNNMYDANIAEAFASQQEAQTSLETFLDSIDAADKDAHLRLLDHTLQAWQQHNIGNACRDVQGTERLQISDSTGVTDHYLILFTTYGPKQLHTHQDYQALSHLQSFEAQTPYFDRLKDYIINHVQKSFADQMLPEAIKVIPGTNIIRQGFLWCEEQQEQDPILALGYIVLYLPRGTSLDKIETLDTVLFDAM